MDSFSVLWEVQVKNLHEIIQFKTKHSDKVILLLGNHDLNYWEGVTQTCSGYQYERSGYYESLFKTYKELFQIAYVHEDTIFTHAGLSISFLYEVLGANSVPISGNSLQNLVNALNRNFESAPELFAYRRGLDGGYGNHPSQSCTWIRPISLLSNHPGFNQVVGHTTFTAIKLFPLVGDKFVAVCDALPYEYLTIEEGKPIIKQL